MTFRNYVNEGRNKWEVFSIKMNTKKWTFKNEGDGKVYYVKISEQNPSDSMFKFLKELGATPPTKPKTFGEIDYKQFANDVMEKKRGSVYVKSGMWDTIRSTWTISEKKESEFRNYIDYINEAIVDYDVGDKIDPKYIIHKEVTGGNIWNIIKRSESKGQDAVGMYIVDRTGKVLVDVGSHVSLDRAKMFIKNYKG